MLDVAWLSAVCRQPSAVSELMGLFRKSHKSTSATSQADAFYFAYGSHLDADQFRERCPSAKAMGLSRLPGYRLAFSSQSTESSCGVADVVPEAGQEVWGLLYTISQSDLEALEQPEGSSTPYQRVTVKLDFRGQVAEALTYEAVHKEACVLPSLEYLRIMYHEGKRWGFPQRYLKQLDQVAERVDSGASLR